MLSKFEDKYLSLLPSGIGLLFGVAVLHLSDNYTAAMSIGVGIFVFSQAVIYPLVRILRWIESH